MPNTAKPRVGAWQSKSSAINPLRQVQTPRPPSVLCTNTLRRPHEICPSVNSTAHCALLTETPCNMRKTHFALLISPPLLRHSALLLKHLLRHLFWFTNP